MLAFIVVHVIAGILLGGYFRIAVMIPAAAVVIGESVLFAGWYDFAPWYWTLAIGLVAIQAGYGLAAMLRPARRPEATSSERTPPISRISAQE